MATKLRLNSWEHAAEPQVLTEPMFRLWQQRINRHRENIKEASCCTNVTQYEKEVVQLQKFTSGHRRARKFRRVEQEEKLRQDNARLVQKICDVARESERRQVQIVSAVCPSTERPTIGATGRRKRQSAIDHENARLLKRLENVKSEMPSAVQTARSYDRHKANSEKMSRMKRPIHSLSRPSLCPAMPPRRARPQPMRTEITRLPPIIDQVPSPQGGASATSSSAPAPWTTPASHVVPTPPATHRSCAPSPRQALGRGSAPGKPVHVPTESLLVVASPSEQKLDVLTVISPSSTPKAAKTSETTRPAKVNSDTTLGGRSAGPAETSETMQELPGPPPAQPDEWSAAAEVARKGVAEIVAKVTGSSFFSAQANSSTPPAAAAVDFSIAQDGGDASDEALEESGAFEDDFEAYEPAESDTADSGAEDLPPPAVGNAGAASGLVATQSTERELGQVPRPIASESSASASPQALLANIYSRSIEASSSPHSTHSNNVVFTEPDADVASNVSLESDAAALAAQGSFPRSADSVNPLATDVVSRPALGGVATSEIVRSGTPDSTVSEEMQLEATADEAQNSSSGFVGIDPIPQMKSSESRDSGLEVRQISEEEIARQISEESQEAARVAAAQDSGSDAGILVQEEAHVDQPQDSASDVELAPLAQDKASEEVLEEAEANERTDSASDVELAALESVHHSKVSEEVQEAVDADAPGDSSSSDAAIEGPEDSVSDTGIEGPQDSASDVELAPLPLSCGIAGAAAVASSPTPHTITGSCDGGLNASVASETFASDFEDTEETFSGREAGLILPPLVAQQADAGCGRAV